MKTNQRGLALVSLVVSAGLLLAASNIFAADLRSPPDDPGVGSTAVEIEIAREEVADLLREHGLNDEEIELRLAALNDEDVLQLSRHAKQIQAGGAPPDYIWILLGALIVVTILATIF